jgi:hypothetical protein
MNRSQRGLRTGLLSLSRSSLQSPENTQHPRDDCQSTDEPTSEPMARAQAVEPLQLVLPWTYAFLHYPYDDSMLCPSSSLQHPNLPAQYASKRQYAMGIFASYSQHFQKPEIVEPLINKPDHHISSTLVGKIILASIDPPQLLSQIKHMYCLSRFSPQSISD